MLRQTCINNCLKLVECDKAIERVIGEMYRRSHLWSDRKFRKVSRTCPKSIKKHHLHRNYTTAERFELFCSSGRYGHEERSFLLQQSRIAVIRPLLQWRICNL